MKLSEAIRLGAMIRPQGSGVYFSLGRSCALGAAFEACGATAYDEGFATSGDYLFSILRMWAPCPACVYDHHRLGFVVTHLNDHHGWTREQIADWVETIEAQHADHPQEQPAPVAVTA